MFHASGHCLDENWFLINGFAKQHMIVFDEFYIRSTSRRALSIEQIPHNGPFKLQPLDGKWTVRVGLPLKFIVCVSCICGGEPVWLTPHLRDPQPEGEREKCLIDSLTLAHFVASNLIGVTAVTRKMVTAWRSCVRKIWDSGSLPH